MAIYYIDPHTTTNGTGTFESPWALGTNTRTGLANGDEIRIKGVALSSLLTATTYTATFTNAQTLTITAGGGLGADFLAGNIIYLPDYDTFVRIASVTTNALAIYSTGMLPIYNTAATTINVRKVDTTTYLPGTASAYYLGSGAINNLTISDCWIDEITRVTDGTVKSLFYSSGTATTSCYFDSSTSGTYGHTVDLPNTHVMPSSNATSSSYVTGVVYGSNSTYVIGQIFSQFVSGGITIGATTAPVYNTSITLTHGGCVLLGTCYGKNITFTATNVATYAADIMVANAVTYVNGLTINFGNIAVATSSYNGGGVFYGYNVYNATVNYNGPVECYAATGLTYVIIGYGNLTVNFHPTNFSYKYNKRVTTQTSVTYLVYSNTAFTGGDVYVIPTITKPTGWTVSNTTYFINVAMISQTAAAKTPRIPNIINVDMPTPTNASIPYGESYNNNTLVTYRDGSNPIEILSIQGNGYSGATTSPSFPVVQRDATVYRTAAPSLKSYLATRNAGYWTSVGGTVKTSTSIKSIKIPVTASVPVTVTGYIRTDDAAYVNGDCGVSLNFIGVDVANQAMTTACINAWEQFTLSFTPTQTGEAYFLWEMYYANGAKSYWLDDLVIT